MALLFMDNCIQRNGHPGEINPRSNASPILRSCARRFFNPSILKTSSVDDDDEFGELPLNKPALGQYSYYSR